MPNRTRLLRALATMPEEAFSWLVLALPPKAMMHGAHAQVWPDGIGGFMEASQQSIAEARAAAKEYIDEAGK